MFADGASGATAPNRVSALQARPLARCARESNPWSLEAMRAILDFWFRYFRYLVFRPNALGGGKKTGLPTRIVQGKRPWRCDMWSCD